MSVDTIPLDRSPPEAACLIVAFPLASRVGKVRHVAAKLAEKTTKRHESFYREQVSDALRNQMSRYQIDPDHQSREITAFWQAVAVEIARQRRTGGAA